MLKREYYHDWKMMPEENILQKRIRMGESSDFTIWFSLTLCTLFLGSSLRCGYHFGVMTGPSVLVRDFYNQTHVRRYGAPLGTYGEAWMWAATITVFCIGRVAGQVAGTKWSAWSGRSRTLIANNAISIVASVLMGTSKAAGSPELLMCGRTAIGFHVGVSLAVVPSYLREVSPINRRDAMGRLHHVFFVAGIVVGQLSGFYLFHTATLWPVALAVAAVMDLFQTTMLLFCPESPRWLMHYRYAEEKAAGALRQLRGTEDVDQETCQLREEHRADSRVVRASVCEVLWCRDSNWKMPFLTCVLLQSARQLSAINAIIFYSTEVFLLAGLSDQQTALACLAWGVTFIVTSVLEYYVNCSRFLRKPSLLIPYGILGIVHAVLTLTALFQPQVQWLFWFSVLAVCAIVAAFAAGPAMMTSVVCSELWSVGPRRAAQKLSDSVNWTVDILLQLAFPVLLVTLGAYTFIIFAGSVILVSVFIYLYVPETKNRRFVEICTGFETLRSLNESLETT